MLYSTPLLGVCNKLCNHASFFKEMKIDEDQALVQDSTPQNDPGTASSRTKTQALVQALLLPSYTLPGYGLSHRPKFVHLIS